MCLGQDKQQKLKQYLKNFIECLKTLWVRQDSCHIIQQMGKRKINVVARPGYWPFLDCIEILQSDYVDPIGHSDYAKDWRSIFLGTGEYGKCLYGTVERYVICEKGKRGSHVAWVHRDDPDRNLAVFKSRRFPIRL